MSESINDIEKTGAELISMERERQVKVEGYTPEHDDAYTKAEGGAYNTCLADAAICYAFIAAADEDLRKFGRVNTNHPFLFCPVHWPWHNEHWKPSQGDSNQDRIKELVKAGALIAAEIDRLQRCNNE